MSAPPPPPPSEASKAARSANTRGAGLMVASMAGYALSDAVLKSIGDVMPLGELLFLRGIFMTVMMLAAARWIGAVRLRLPVREWVLILLRGLADLGATYFFVTALLNMPIANVTAILQVLPLSVALAAAVFLREPLGWRRVTAILIGFAGVMLIIRPGAEGFDAWSLWALAAVGFITVRDLVTRPLDRDTPSSTVAFASAVIVMIGGGVTGLFEPWVPAAPATLGMLGLAALFMVIAFTAAVATMRVGDIGFVSPFRYTGLIWALILGLVVFGDWPDNLTLLGAGIVVVTGIFTLYREHKLAAKRS